MNPEIPEETREPVETVAESASTNRTRREFLELGLAAGGLGILAGAPVAFAQDSACPFPDPGVDPVPFEPPVAGSVLPRVSAFATEGDSEAPQLTLLRKAYSAMRQLTVDDPTDPRGMMHQANVHCSYCAGDAHEVHGSWSFLAWHRCYLFMHERILGKLIDDPSVRLAHWDWDTPSRNLIPPAFKVGSLDDPLRRSMLDAPIPASLVGTAAMDAAMRPMTFTGFGGGMSNAGSLEMNPHGPVHCWTSCDAPNCCQPNMGVLATAARDPIFYAHHSNIDRLWAVWLAQGGGRSNPSDPSWLDMQWTFFDENKVWTSISVRDVLDYESNLGYSYECLEYSSEHCETGGMRTLDVVELAAEPIRMTAEPETASVSMPAHFKAAAAAAVAAPRPERIHYLHIDGIHVPSHKAALLRVFANAPDATAETDIDTPNFLGYISAVAKVESSDEGHDHGKFNAVLDMTHFSIELFAADDFYVTLVPVGLSGSDDAVAHDVTYERIYLTNE